MWHVSIASQKIVTSIDHRFDVARQQLDGVGIQTPDTEWEDTGLHAVHLRRRLNTHDLEQLDPGHREMVDCRGWDSLSVAQLIASTVQSHDRDSGMVKKILESAKWELDLKAPTRTPELHLP